MSGYDLSETSGADYKVSTFAILSRNFKNISPLFAIAFPQDFSHFKNRACHCLAKFGTHRNGPTGWTTSKRVAIASTGEQTVS